jgi:hypothetical protein
LLRVVVKEDGREVVVEERVLGLESGVGSGSSGFVLGSFTSFHLSGLQLDVCPVLGMDIVSCPLHWTPGHYDYPPPWGTVYHDGGLTVGQYRHAVCTLFSTLDVATIQFPYSDLPC